MCKVGLQRSLEKIKTKVESFICSSHVSESFQRFDFVASVVIIRRQGIIEDELPLYAF